MTATPPNPEILLEQSDLIHDEQTVQAAIDGLAGKITADFGNSNPLVMCVMGGAVVFAGQLLPKLQFPLIFDYVHASRYHDQTHGQQHLVWKVTPDDKVRGRIVILLDDILDEGHTLAAVKQKCLEQGAAKVVIVVLADKLLGHAKPIMADYVGLQVPNRYVFGCG
ncbi:MAG TPA: hypoxanthine-guanine phosphoribosyltransferase, partial [Methylophilaceae bacterium]|nr:hypoxanthine-guanine phosphoribosyltransferase [Methylophilaceae bacterium]